MHGHDVGGGDRFRYVRDIGQVMVLCSLFGYGMASYTEAAEWSVAPSLSVKGIYNSNLLLTPLPHHESYGYWVSPAAEFAGKTERLEVSSRMAADFAGYFGGEERQFTNVFVPLSLRYRTDKDLIGFTGGFTRHNTLLGELQETGVVLDFTQRNQWAMNPTWTRSLTERLSLETNVQFSDTTYESSRLVDYRLVGGSGGLLYQLTERDKIRLSWSYSAFRTSDSPFPFRASFPGINMSLTHAFDESLTGSVYGGPKFLSSSTQTPFGNVESQETVWLAGANITKKFERAVVNVSFARDLTPSGFGLLIQTNRGEASGSFDLSETLNCSLNVVGLHTTGKASAAIGGIFPDSNYISATPKISWKFFEWWQAELSYMYRWRNVDTAIDSASSHATTFMVSYYPPQLTLSH